MIRIDLVASTNATSGAYNDASGAPAVVRDGAFVWSCDTIGGEIVVRYVSGPKRAGRVESRVSMARATACYRNEVFARLSQEWLNASRALYAEIA